MESMSRKQTNKTINRIATRTTNFGHDNLHVYLSMSPKNLMKNSRREELRSEKSRSLPISSKSTKRVPLIVGVQSRSRYGAVTSGLPEDVAVHFGKFYGSRNVGEHCQDSRTTKSEFPASQTPRFEFTRQMVHELERLAGTEDYARQVSAILDSTVESPNFDVKPPPIDNFVVHESSEPWDYPLWYKEPDKMTSSSIVDSKQENQTRKQPRDECFVTNSVHSIVSGSQGFVEDVNADWLNNDESSTSSSSSSDFTRFSVTNTEENF